MGNVQGLQRALALLGIRSERDRLEQPDYAQLLREALDRVRTAELLMREATTFEQLDVARSALSSAQAELQQLIRSAKREQGIALRPVMENEEMHRQMQDYMGRAVGDRTGMRRRPFR